MLTLLSQAYARSKEFQYVSYKEKEEKDVRTSEVNDVNIQTLTQNNMTCFV